MDSEAYEVAAHGMKRYMEDNSLVKLENKARLEEVLAEVLATKYMERYPHFSSVWAAQDDAAMIVNNLDTLRPVLEAWWSNVQD